VGRSLTLIGVCGAITLAGCGGSSSGGLSRAQVAAEVDPICVDFKREGGAIPVPPDFITDQHTAALYLDRVIKASDRYDKSASEPLARARIQQLHPLRFSNCTR